MRSKRKLKVTWRQRKEKHTTTQNLWDTVKAVPRGKFIALQAYLKKQERAEINNLTLHLKELKKQQTAQSEQKEENNKDQTRNQQNRVKKTMQKFKETKMWFSEKKNKIDKPLTDSTRKKER